MDLIYEQMRNVKMLVLANETSDYCKVEKAVRGAGYRFTAYDPFSRDEQGTRGYVKGKLDAVRKRDPGWHVPIVFSVRIEKERSSRLRFKRQSRNLS